MGLRPSAAGGVGSLLPGQEPPVVTQRTVARGETGGAHAATELRAAQDAHGQRPNPRNVRRVNVSLEQIQDDGLWKW